MQIAPTYTLGHAEFELQRLQLQAGIFAAITSRLIRESGIGPGMRVLEIGCGIGDVSMLLAEAVGDRGSVVAFDREPRAIEVARARTAAAGYRQVTFVAAGDDALPDRPEFDAAVGRYVLIHQADPVAMIRRCSVAVRNGGIIAFHEIAVHLKARTLPVVELHENLEKSLNSTFDAMLPHADVGGRMVRCFSDAGLPVPRLIWECIAGGPDSPLWTMFAMTYRSMLPHIARLMFEPERAGDPDTLAERLHAAAATVRSQIVSKPQVCAWTIRP
jgi:ubiquinone/menaquinone biosynthesis C-methylase UbiE